MKGICSWCRDAPGVIPCPDSQCPDETALCKDCEPVFLFCPDHAGIQFIWDPQLSPEMNRTLASSLGIYDKPKCPKCGVGELNIQYDFGFIDPIGIRQVTETICSECGDIITRRVIWDPITVRLRQDQLVRWKKTIGQLDSQLHQLKVWAAYIGNDLAEDLFALVREAKHKLYENSIGQ